MILGYRISEFVFFWIIFQVIIVKKKNCNKYYNNNTYNLFYFYSKEKLGRYESQTVELVLPSGITVDDIDYFSVYCVSQSVDFGNVRLPATVYNVPPYIPPPVVRFLVL